MIQLPDHFPKKLGCILDMKKGEDTGGIIFYRWVVSEYPVVENSDPIELTHRK